MSLLSFEIQSNVVNTKSSGLEVCVIISCVFSAFAAVHCCFVVTCWERADLLALVCDVNP